MEAWLDLDMSAFGLLACQCNALGTYLYGPFVSKPLLFVSLSSTKQLEALSHKRDCLYCTSLHMRVQPIGVADYKGMIRIGPDANPIQVRETRSTTPLGSQGV